MVQHATAIDPHAAMVPDETTAETTSVTCTVLDVRPVQLSKLIALASVEIIVAGISFTLHGIQVVRRAQDGREITVARLPSYRGPDGRWLPSVNMPEELKRPIGDAVIAQCLDMGLVREGSLPEISA